MIDISMSDYNLYPLIPSRAVREIVLKLRGGASIGECFVILIAEILTHLTDEACHTAPPLASTRQSLYPSLFRAQELGGRRD